MVIWVRDVGCIDERGGVDGGGDMRSNKGHILKLEPTEIVNGSEVDITEKTMMTNSSSQHQVSTSHVRATALFPLQVKIHPIFARAP